MEDAERVRQQNIVVVRSIDQAPVARHLLHFEAAVRPCIWRNHVQAQTQRRLEVAGIPLGRHVARHQGIPPRIERPRQDILVIVERAAVLEGRRPREEVGLLHHQRIMVLGTMPGPLVQRINPQPLTERVGGECGPAEIRAHQPHTMVLCQDLKSLPFPLETALSNFRGHRAMAEGHEVKSQSLSAWNGNNRRTIAADLLDVLAEKLCRLAHRGVFARSDADDAALGPLRQNDPVTGRRRHPRSANRTGPGLICPCRAL